MQDIRPVHYLGMGVLVAWMVFALFSYPMSIPALALVLPGSLTGISTALNGKESLSGRNKTGSSFFKVKNFFAGVLLLTVSTYALYWTNQYRPLSQNWMVANANQELQRFDLANSLYNNLSNHLQNEGLFLQFAGKSYSQSRQFHASARMLERSLFFGADPTIFTTLGKDYTLFSKVDPQKKERAEFLLTRAKYISPHKYYPRYLLAKYYKKTEKPIKAVEEAEAVLAIKPKVSSAAVDKIREEMAELILDQEKTTPEVLLSEEEK